MNEGRHHSTRWCGTRNEKWRSCFSQHVRGEEESARKKCKSGVDRKTQRYLATNAEGQRKAERRTCGGNKQHSSVFHLPFFLSFR